MSRILSRILVEIRSAKRSIEKKTGETSIIIVLLGAGGRGLRQRRALRNRLASMGMVALIPEDDFPREVAPSLVEEAVLSKGDVELVFINVESWGTATEFAQFHGSRRIAGKLRVLVEHEHHPLYGSSASYLTDVYLTHLAVFGHVYAVDDSRRTVFPTVREVVVKLAERYRVCKAPGFTR
ncbi:MAG: hypothetical protein QW566_04390 [Candidatus Jordarchaeales archaeon]